MSFGNGGSSKGNGTRLAFSLVLDIHALIFIAVRARILRTRGKSPTSRPKPSHLYQLQFVETPGLIMLSSPSHLLQQTESHSFRTQSPSIPVLLTRLSAIEMQPSSISHLTRNHSAQHSTRRGAVLVPVRSSHLVQIRLS